MHRLAHRATLLTLSVTLLAWSALPAAFGDSFRTYKGRECTVKTNAPAAVGKLVAKRIDNYVDQFAEFFDAFDLDAKNDNRIVARIFDTYEDYAEHYSRRSEKKSPPMAYFSSSMNAIVLYNDELDLTLRQTLFHEASHNFFNRFTYDEPPWLNEGLAEYFEGWEITAEGEFVSVRPNIYDLMIVRAALESDEALSLEELFGLSHTEWKEHGTRHPELHGYLHYCTAWSVVYHCLESGHEGDRERLATYFRDLNEDGARAQWPTDDLDEFEARWRATVLGLDVERTTAEAHMLVAGGQRSNGDYADAAKEYAAALKLDAEAPRVRYWLGYCLKRSSQYDEATAMLQAALEHDPDEASAAYMLSRITLGVDKPGSAVDVEKATAWIERALDIVDGESASYLLMLARCQEASGNPKAAVKTVRKILRMVDEESAPQYEEWLDRFREAEKSKR